MSTLNTIEQLANAIVAIRELIENREYRGLAANDVVFRQLLCDFSYYVDKNQREKENNSPRNAGVFQVNPNNNTVKQLK